MPLIKQNFKCCDCNFESRIMILALLHEFLNPYHWIECTETKTR